MRPVDAFDLPDWLGTSEVTWSAESTDRGGHRVRGSLTASDHAMPCDLFAVDQAWPHPVVDEALRQEVHSAWRSGEIVVAEDDEGRLLVLTPGIAFAPADAMESIRRFARAVAAPAHQYLVALRLDAWNRGTSADRG